MKNSKKQLSHGLIIILTITLGQFFGPSAASFNQTDGFFPSPILVMDDEFSHHVLVAEKSTHRLYVFENNSSRPKLVKIHQMATGKKAGNKVFQGDFRTPEGIYHLTNFIPNSELVQKYGEGGEIYGVGAFVMDYPNPIDRNSGKTGGGIWIHSTNNETRIDKGLDSRGCIVTANDNLKEISKYIELNKTSIVVVHDLKYLDENTWTNTRKELLEFIDKWKVSWATENHQDYVSHYHPSEFMSRKGGFRAYSKYKKAVFLAPGAPKIDLTNISIFHSGTYAVASFKQFYESETINDIGKKVLYLKKDEFYRWKIVSELWTKAGIDSPDQVADFTPSMRFFKDLKESSN